LHFKVRKNGTQISEEDYGKEVGVYRQWSGGLKLTQFGGASPQQTTRVQKKNAQPVEGKGKGVKLRNQKAGKETSLICVPLVDGTSTECRNSRVHGVQNRTPMLFDKKRIRGSRLATPDLADSKRGKHQRGVGERSLRRG